MGHDRNGIAGAGALAFGMNAGMHIHHEAVEMGPPLPFDRGGGKKEVHQQGLAAPDIAPDVESLGWRRGLPKQRKAAALFAQGRSQRAQPARGIGLRIVSLQLTPGQGLVIKPHASVPIPKFALSSISVSMRISKPR